MTSILGIHVNELPTQSSYVQSNGCTPALSSSSNIDSKVFTTSIAEPEFSYYSPLRCTSLNDFEN
jgi:hypothetical protein